MTQPCHSNHIVYEGLTCFDNNRRIANILDIPGVVDAGWTSLAIYKSSTERDRNVNQTKLNQSLKTLMEKVRSHKACKQLLSLNYPNFRDEVGLFFHLIGLLFLILSISGSKTNRLVDGEFAVEARGLLPIEGGSKC